MTSMPSKLYNFVTVLILGERRSFGSRGRGSKSFTASKMSVTMCTILYVHVLDPLFTHDLQKAPGIFDQ